MLRPTRFHTSHGAEQANSLFTKTIRVLQAEPVLDRFFYFRNHVDIVLGMSSDPNSDPFRHANTNTPQHAHAVSNADTARITFTNVCADTRSRHRHFARARTAKYLRAHSRTIETTNASFFIVAHRRQQMVFN